MYCKLIRKKHILVFLFWKITMVKPKIERTFHVKDNNIIFKAGSTKEITESLANYCQIPITQIKEKDIQEIYEKYSIENSGLADALWEKFNGNTLRTKHSQFRLYHYHRTSSNNNKEWFAKGILNKDLGIKEFINNLKIFCDIDLYKYEEKIRSNNNTKHSISQANDGDEYGPYSFISMEYAEENSGYDIPEILTQSYFGEDRDEIFRKIKETLKPVIVVYWFDYLIKDLDKCLAAYCEMFLNYSCEYRSFEPNSIVPFENIESVKIIQDSNKFNKTLNPIEAFNNSHTFRLTM